MIVTEENGVLRVTTSEDEIMDVLAAFANGDPCEFEEAGGRRTIVFAEEPE